MLYSQQLHPGLLVNRDNSPTSGSSQATSYICQVWKTALQMHCLALLKFIHPQPHPQLHPQPKHQYHRLHRPWFPSCFLRHFLRKTSSLLRVLLYRCCLHYSCSVLQFNPRLPILPFKYCHFHKVILQSSTMSPPALSTL